MEQTRLTRATAVGALAFAGALALAGPAWAQTVPLPTSPISRPPTSANGRAASSSASRARAASSSTRSPPNSHRNFGQLTTDLSNAPVLNQAVVTLSRDVDPKATSVDIGFKVQLMYGSDARIYHTLAVFDQLIHNRYQLDVPEASISIRVPQWFANGFDFKAGSPHPDGRGDDRPQAERILHALLHLQLRAAVQEHRRHRDGPRLRRARPVFRGRYGREHVPGLWLGRQQQPARRHRRASGST